MTRRTAGYLILGAWGFSLAWLVARRAFAPAEERLAAAAARIGPSASFYAVLHDGRQIGTAGITLDTVAMGFRLVETVSLDLPDGRGASGRLLGRLEGNLFRSFRIHQAVAALNEGPGVPRLLELIPGTDTTLLLRYTRPARGTDVVLGFEDGRPVLSSAFSFQLAAQGRLRAGAAFAVEGVHPLLLARLRETGRVTGDSTFAVSDTAAFDSTAGKWVTVAAEPVRAWRVERTSGGPPVEDWIDSQGRVLRRTFAFGLTVERSPFEVNYTNYQATRAGTRSAGAGPLAGRRPSRAAAPRRQARLEPLEVILARSDGPAWPGAVATLAGGRQTVRGDTVRVEPVADAVDGAPPPTRRRNIGGLPAADLRALQSALDDALAANASADTLAALVRWVAQDVRYQETPLTAIGGGTAARDRRAGVEGKAHLLAALAELAGIPARVVSGVDVRQEGLPAHTWVEVWLRGWLAVDPTSGDLPARTSLLRIFEGAARPLAMAMQVGALRASVLSGNAAGEQP
jgi:hypothetical protein